MKILINWKKNLILYFFCLPLITYMTYPIITICVSAVFNLPEGRLLSYFSIVPHDHILDVPNAFLGLLYYSVILTIEQCIYHNPNYKPTMKYMTFILNCLAMSSSLYLAWKLIMIAELCLLCWTTHLLNYLLVSNFGKRLFMSSSLERKKVEWEGWINISISSGWKYKNKDGLELKKWRKFGCIMTPYRQTRIEQRWFTRLQVNALLVRIIFLYQKIDKRHKEDAQII